MKPRARYSYRLRSWACWMTPADWYRRTVGFGFTWQEAYQDWLEQVKA